MDLERRLSIHRAVGQVLATAGSMRGAALGLVEALTPLTGSIYGALWSLEQGGHRLACAGAWAGTPSLLGFIEANRDVRLQLGEGLPGRVLQTGAPHWIPDVLADGNFPRAAGATDAGLRCAFAVPVLRDGQAVAAMEFMGPSLRQRDDDLVSVLGEVADHLGLFIESQRAQQARRESEQLKGAILEAALDAVITIDAAGTIVEFNPAAEAMFGHKRGEVRGRALGDIVIPPHLRAAHDAGMRHYLATGEGPILRRRIETMAMRRGGATFPVELTVVPIEMSGQTPLFTAYLRDITQRVEAEAQLRRHAEELARQHHQKDAFLAMLAHELRNPLAPVSNAVHLLARVRSDDPMLQAARDVIERQVRTLTRLVDDLLDVSRITRGRIELQASDVRVAAVVADAVELAMPVIRGRGHQLDVSVADEAATFRADATRVIQVLANLLTNAAKYTPEGGHIALEARIDAGHAVFVVRDNGMGIAPELLPHVFDLFVQGDQAIERSQGGLGIGLTLVKALVQQHGGDVQARSAGVGRGSEFVVRFPLQPSAAAATVAQA